MTCNRINTQPNEQFCHSLDFVIPNTTPQINATKLRKHAPNVDQSDPVRWRVTPLQLTVTLILLHLIQTRDDSSRYTGLAQLLCSTNWTDHLTFKRKWIIVNIPITLHITWQLMWWQHSRCKIHVFFFYFSRIQKLCGWVQTSF